MSLDLLVKLASELENKSAILKIAKGYGKYSEIDFEPTPDMAASAARGLELAQANPKFKLKDLIRRGTIISKRSPITPTSIKRMLVLLNKRKDHAEPTNDASKDMKHIGFLLLGGVAGLKWAEEVSKKIEAADQKQVQAYTYVMKLVKTARWDSSIARSYR